LLPTCDAILTGARGRLVVGADHDHGVALGAAGDGLLRHHDAGRQFRLRQAHAHVLARQQGVVRVRTSARSVTWPEVGSTVTSENSSLPLRGNSVPSSSRRSPGAARRRALPPALLRRRCSSEADWVKLTYTVLVCWISASWVASVALTPARLR
jgi:hypothetical protein